MAYLEVGWRIRLSGEPGPFVVRDTDLNGRVVILEHEDTGRWWGVDIMRGMRWPLRARDEYEATGQVRQWLEVVDLDGQVPFVLGDEQDDIVQLMLPAVQRRLADYPPFLRRKRAHGGSITLRVELVDMATPVWREIKVPDYFTLSDLHAVIQGSFAWLDYHPHEFQLGNVVLSRLTGEGEDYGELDERDVVLGQYLRPKQVFWYLYDYGDRWMHRCTVTRMTREGAWEENILDGEGDAPAEDSGGPYAWATSGSRWSSSTSYSPSCASPTGPTRAARSRMTPSTPPTGGATGRGR